MVEREHRGEACRAGGERLCLLERGEPPSGLSAAFDQRSDVAAVLVPGVVSVIVGQRQRGINRLDQCAMELQPISDSVVRGTLAGAVQIIG